MEWTATPELRPSRKSGFKEWEKLTLLGGKGRKKGPGREDVRTRWEGRSVAIDLGERISGKDTESSSCTELVSEREKVRKERTETYSGTTMGEGGFRTQKGKPRPFDG